MHEKFTLAEATDDKVAFYSVGIMQSIINNQLCAFVTEITPFKPIVFVIVLFVVTTQISSVSSADKTSKYDGLVTLIKHRPF